MTGEWHLPGVIAAFLLYVGVGILPSLAAIYVVYFLLTLPLRRNERGRLLLDLLQMGLNAGHSPERALLEPALSRDRSLGVRFHLLAAHLESGLTLGQALDQVPRLLPPQLNAMLKAGEYLGNVGAVIPAARQLLRDGVSHVRSAMNYLVLLAFVVTPFSVGIPLVIQYKILPSYKAVFEGMLEGMALPAFTRLVFATDSYYNAALWLILAFLWTVTLLYIGGPRLRSWIDRVLPGLPDRLAFAVPWRRKRLQRDFSSMLALLLDNDVPETRALQLAADATANRVMQHRANKTRSLLESGVSLNQALAVMDDSRELQWRLANALHAPRNFSRSLAGWHETLDARAFQLEQSAAQIVTTLLVLFNGLIVASVVIGMFLVLIALLNQATLW